MLGAVAQLAADPEAAAGHHRPLVSPSPVPSSPPGQDDPLSALGTSNDFYLSHFTGSQPNGDCINPAGGTMKCIQRHGLEWEQMVAAVANYVDYEAFYSDRIAVHGSSDIEVDWSSYDDSKLWLDGYQTNWDTDLRRMYYFGDAGGCPSAARPLAGCNNNWSQDQLIDVAWRAAPSRPVPQIYRTNGAMALQWQQLVVRSSSGGSEVRINVSGALTQNGACTSQDTRNACRGQDIQTWNSEEMGWVQLQEALNSDLTSSQPVRWATEIDWQS